MAHSITAQNSIKNGFGDDDKDHYDIPQDQQEAIRKQLRQEWLQAQEQSSATSFAGPINEDSKQKKNVVEASELLASMKLDSNEKHMAELKKKMEGMSERELTDLLRSIENEQLDSASDEASSEVYSESTEEQLGDEEYSSEERELSEEHAEIESEIPSGNASYASEEPNDLPSMEQVLQGDLSKVTPKLVEEANAHLFANEIDLKAEIVHNPLLASVSQKLIDEAKLGGYYPGDEAMEEELKKGSS